jgi:DNA polymerase-3 subunit beta
MKALCNREGLQTAFAMVSGVVPLRSPKPVLQNVKLEVDDSEGTTLLATDLEVGIRYRVLGLKVERPGSLILPTQRFSQILRTMGDVDLALEVDSEHIHIRGQHAQFKLLGEDPELFPEVADFGASSYYVLGAADLRRAIRRTVFATDVESTRYALGGVLFELSENTLILVGTDGRRLARQVIPIEHEGDIKAPAGQPVVPVKALKLLERNLQDEDPPVHLAFQGNTAVLVRTDRAVIYSRLVEGRFPRYQDVFPTQVEVRVPLEVGPLLSAVEQASIVTSEESRGVDFQFKSDLLKLVSQAPDQGSSDVELPIHFDGKPLEITFDPRYLADALKMLNPTNPITAELIDGKNAAVFKTDDLYTYVVMPLTKDR